MADEVPGRRVRHPRRRAGPAASRTTRTSRPSPGRPATASPGTGCTTAGSTTAGEKMSKSLGNRCWSLEVLTEQVAAGGAPLLPGRPRTTARRSSAAAGVARRGRRPPTSGSRASCSRASETTRRVADADPSDVAAAGGLRRGDGRRPRRPGRARRRCTRPCARATPRSPPATSDGAAAARWRCGRWWTCSASTRWTRTGRRVRRRRTARRSRALDALVGRRAGRSGRRPGRPKDFATADAIRDRLARGRASRSRTLRTAPRWTPGAATTDGRQLVAHAARCDRKPASKKGATVGSGGQGRRGAAGKGPTPKATERTDHPAARKAAAAQRRPAQRGPAGAGGGGAPSGRPSRAVRRAAARRVGTECVAGRNPVVEALRPGVPAKALYVAQRDRRTTTGSGRPCKLAASRGSRCSRATRATWTG